MFYYHCYGTPSRPQLQAEAFPELMYISDSKYRLGSFYPNLVASKLEISKTQA